MSPILEQEKTLKRIIQLNKNTSFGIEHSFKEIKSIEDYQKLVPIREYEDFYEEYLKDNYKNLKNILVKGRIKTFAKSSGTTSESTKLIPVSKLGLKIYRKGALSMYASYFLENKKSNLFFGKIFVLGASSKLENMSSLVKAAPISGIHVANLPFWTRFFYYPNKKISKIESWRLKLDKIVKHIKLEKISAINGMPAWIELFIEEYKKERQLNNFKLSKKLKNLELLVHGVVSITPYKENLKSLFPKAKFREVYVASEGFIAYSDISNSDEMLLCLNSGIFYEFIELKNFYKGPPFRRLTFKNVELTKNYVLVISNFSGFYAYILGDVITFSFLSPFRIKISGRTKQTFSIRGEHLLVSEIEKALASVFDYNEFCAGISISSAKKHIYLVELKKPLEANLEDLKVKFDNFLKNKNLDYKNLRSDDIILDSPEIIILKTNTFKIWLKKKNKLGDQHKVPRVILDKRLFNQTLIELKEISNII